MSHLQYHADGNIAQQLYNTVDSIVVGRYVGDNALAAVGSASPILNLLLVLFVGISRGSIMVSQYFRAKQRGIVRLHRMQHYADSHFFCNYHDTGAAGDQAAAEASEYAGQHYGLVCLI
ncbi:MAG: MATE family efflux transporter [Eisenbergiella sp.]